MKNWVLFTLIFSVVLIGCDSSKDNSSNGKNNPALSTQNTTSSSTSTASAKSEVSRDYAIQVLESRIKNEPEAFQLVDAGLWSYEFVFSGREMSKPGEYDGHWIDFSPDFSYKYGYYDDERGNGRYHFSINTSTLIMVDNNKDEQAQEWEVKNAGDVMVLVGRSTFGKNSRQIKLNRVQEVPTK